MTEIGTPRPEREVTIEPAIEPVPRRIEIPEPQTVPLRDPDPAPVEEPERVEH